MNITSLRSLRVQNFLLLPAMVGAAKIWNPGAVAGASKTVKKVVAQNLKYNDIQVISGQTHSMQLPVSR